MVLGAAAAVWRRAWAPVLACATLWCCTAPALAWTRASVETAEAQVEVLPSGRTRVALQIGIRVYGGWLSRFELSGLGRDLELDGDTPPSMECEDGRTLTPGLRTDARGHVLVSFGDKPDAPRRGLHRLSLHYSIALTEAEVTDGSAATFSFALPAFAVDLKQVDLLVQAPPGTQLVRPDPDAALSFEHQENADHIAVHMHRARLPRTLHFGVELVLPVEIAHALQTKRSGAAASRSMGPLLASALVLLLCALKRRAARVSAELCRVQPRPLLELAAAWRAALMFGAALAAAASYDKRPELGLASLALCVGLALERGFGAATAATNTTTTTTTNTNTTTASAARARSATWTRILFGGASWLDATTPLGAALLGSAYALAFLRLALGQGPGLWLETLLLATPLWLTGTRIQMQDVARRALDSAGPGSAHGATSADAGLRARDRAA